MKNYLKKSILFLVQVSLSFTISRRLINWLFETKGNKIREFFMRSISQPKQNIDWEVYLLNGKKINIEIKNDNHFQWDVALAYQTQDVGINYVEMHLNDHYDNNYLALDIGANIGLRSFYALSTGRRVILFEPNHFLKKYSEGIFNRNGFENYKIENIALSNTIGNAEFYISSSSYLSSLIKENAGKDDGTKFETIVTPTQTLDNYLLPLKDSIPKIIKIDVEGFEYEVIQGALNTIKEHKPAFIIEINQDSKNRQKIFELFSDLKYELFAINSNGTKVLTQLSKDPLFLTHNNYLFIYDTELLQKIKAIVD